MPTAASTTTAEPVFVGASSVVAIYTVAAAKGSDAGDGCTVGADAMKAQEPGSQQQEECVVVVAPEKEAEEGLAASRAMHDVPGA